ncbi:MAG TPA: serine hydrolase domain-containing protein, partial [Thermoanaerobaculia bacterium]|nr:serine hydrolase domain-containing protein [Thermoanaerobaculia bacterium]
MKPRIAILFSLLFVSAAAAASERPELDEFFRAHIRDERVPGIVAGIINGGDEWIGTYGLADVENATPMKADSSFRLASITKTMTAVAILQLVERGKVDLDAEVQTYVSYFPRKKWPVTIRQLLGHLGGIPHYVNRAAEQHIKEHRTTREAIAIFENYDLVAEPGTKYSYSSYGYNLLGAVIESASGQTYADYMREHIWAPLAMTSTRMDDPVDLIPNRVRGYRFIDGRLANSEFIDISSRFAAGGLRTTVPDLLRFARGLMNGTLISPKSFALMSTSMRTRDGALTGYGMGCFVYPGTDSIDTNGRFAIANDGGQQETRTYLMMFPARNMALATAMNLEANIGEPQFRHMLQSLLGEPYNFTPTSHDRAERIVLSAMQTVFTLGHAKRESLLPSANGEEGAALFNKIVNNAVKGVDVAQDRDALEALGAQMAAELAGDYASKGAVVFFRDYAARHRSAFPRWLTSRLPQWADDWAASTPREVRMLTIDASLDPNVLRKALAGHTIIPNFAEALEHTVEVLAKHGDPRAADFGALAVELYPAAGVAHAARAIAAVAAGDDATARAELRRAEALDANRERYSRVLNGVAYTLPTDRAIALLLI